MANELTLQTVPAQTGFTLYAVIFDATGRAWNVTTAQFVTYQDSGFANYAVNLTETPAASGLYLGDFPTAITTAGVYDIAIYERAGATPAATDNQVGAGDVEWDGTQSLQPQAPGQFVNLSYVNTLLNLTTAQATASAAYLSFLINVATQVIKRYIRRDITQTNYSEYYDGTGSSQLTLKQYPVIGVTSVTYFPHDPNPTVIAGSNFAIDYPTGIIAAIPATAQFYRFPKGFQNVLVSYTAGYSSIPLDIQYVTAGIVKYLYLQQGTGLLTSGRKLGDYQAEYETKAMAVISMNYDLLRVLDQYRDHPI